MTEMQKQELMKQIQAEFHKIAETLASMELRLHSKVEKKAA